MKEKEMKSIKVLLVMLGILIFGGLFALTGVSSGIGILILILIGGAYYYFLKKENK